MAKKEALSRLAAPVTIYPQVLINVRVKDKRAAQDDPAVREAVEGYLLSVRQDWDKPDASGLTHYSAWVYAARVTAAMLSVRGVINVTDLTLNRKAEDLALSETGELQQVPVLGEVELRA